MNNSITSRVDALRSAMRCNGIHAVVIPSSDPHCGEYVPEHWHCREWISGFDGSAGTAVVTLSDARLWTDSRYYIAATQQLQGTPFSLMRDGASDTPSITQWLASTLQPGDVVATDGWVWDYTSLSAIKEELLSADLQLRTDIDLPAEVWTDRPSLPLEPIELQPLEYAGESAASKLARLRHKLNSTCQHQWHLLLCALDDIAWLCNIRCTDVHCTPLAVSNLVVDNDSAVLFIDQRKVTDDVRKALLAEGIAIDDYDNLRVPVTPAVILNKATCNYALVQPYIDSGTIIVDDNTVALMKSVKNDVEINGFRNAMRRDGVAMVKFYVWLEKVLNNLNNLNSLNSLNNLNNPNNLTELTIDQVLTDFRAQQPLFRGLSFDTIAAYGPHGAIVHYEATPESNITLEPHGFLLLDSGAQYRDGTTDITRTIPLGPLTEQQQRDYTLVLKGHIALATLRFPEGTAGTRIDAFARYALWQQGMNYGHGTGHGVGSYLSVHEGPHQIRHSWKPTGLVPGMTVTNEPGLYREGSHGVRIENTMLVVADGETEFGRFCRLEPLTLCPFDLQPVVTEMLTPQEVDYINTYHQTVWNELSPLLSGDELDWLRNATKAI